MNKTGNLPRIEIQYLVDIELSVDLTNSTLNHELSKQSEVTKDTNTINGTEVEKEGKKGFFLSGGSVDETTGEISGCLMDGTYTFFDDVYKYPGALGEILSDSNGEFRDADGNKVSQTISIQTANAGSYIKHLVLYFDSVAGEYASSLIFSNSPNKIEKNTRSIYLKNFGEDSTLTSVSVNFDKWSKKNSLAKILKLKTGIRGIYDYNTIKNLKFSNEKISEESEVSFGITNQYCDMSILDKTGDILAIYNADLFLDNVVAEIYIVNDEDKVGEDGNIYSTQTKDKVGEFILETKNNVSGTILWEYSLIDKLEQTKTLTVTALEVASRTLYQILNYVLQFSGFTVEWSDDAKSYAQGLVIDNSYLNPGQFVYDAICKCCEVGLLKVFIAPNGNVRVERGL